MSLDAKFLEYVKKIIYKVFEKEGLLKGEWQLGKVESIISSKKISVYINGSPTPQTVAANPDVNFNIGDEIWVISPNRDTRSMFALCKRGV